MNSPRKFTVLIEKDEDGYYRLPVSERLALTLGPKTKRPS
jgi:hypothetical protein